MLTEQQRSTFKALWNAKRSVETIAEKLGLTKKQVTNYRPALGLQPRNKGQTKYAKVLVSDATMAALTARAKELRMPKARLMGIVLEKYAKENHTTS